MPETLSSWTKSSIASSGTDAYEWFRKFAYSLIQHHTTGKEERIPDFPGKDGYLEATQHSGKDAGRSSRVLISAMLARVLRVLPVSGLHVYPLGMKRMRVLLDPLIKEIVRMWEEDKRVARVYDPAAGMGEVLTIPASICAEVAGMDRHHELAKVASYLLGDGSVQHCDYREVVLEDLSEIDFIVTAVPPINSDALVLVEWIADALRKRITPSGLSFDVVLVFSSKPSEELYRLIVQCFRIVADKSVAEGQYMLLRPKK